MHDDSSYSILSIIDAELHANSNIEDNMEAIVAEIAGLMAKIERLNERQLRANQQAQAVVAKKWKSLKNEDVSVTICMVEVGGGGMVKLGS